MTITSTLRRIRLIALIIAALALIIAPVRSAAAWDLAEGDTVEDWFENGDKFYTVNLESGEKLFTVGMSVNVDDEYISGDNQHYVITSVDTEAMSATARHTGAEEMPAIDWLKPAAALDNLAIPASANKSGNRHIAIYATHTDESYVPSDGTSSEDSGGGILDVANALKGSFEEQGITVTMDTTSHLPHDNGAYRRSRQTASELMKNMPDALIDVHRDGIPDPDEYVSNVNGSDVVKVRLLVGKSNQNSAANKDFAKQIKAVADEQYPGLVKDIFIGKGSYNQDLSPRSILLEFGTHTTSKERAIKATNMIATAMTSVLYGQAANGQSGANTGESTAKTSGGGIGTGIIWIVGFVIVAALAYAFLATGSGKGMVEKLKRNTSEITGGLIGKGPDDHDNDHQRNGRRDDNTSPQ